MPEVGALLAIFDSLDEEDTKDKITKDSGYELKNLRLYLIGKKLREEEYKKNIKKSRKGTNSNTNSKTFKPVNAMAKDARKAGSAGKRTV